MKTKSLAALLLSVSSVGSQAAVSCKELTEYRDQYLANALDKSFKSYSKLSDAKRELEKLKSQVQSNRKGAKFVGDSRLLLQALNTAASAFGGIVSLTPGTAQVIGGATGWARRVLDGQAVLDRAQLDEPVSLFIYEMAQRKGGLFAAAQTIKDFYENVKGMSEAQRERDVTLDTLDNAIATADRELASLQADLRKQETSATLINRVKNQIDAECNGR